MRRPVLAVCLALSPLAAAADCLTADSLTTGIVFKRADGRSGLAIARDGGVFIDYSTGPGTYTDERQTSMGIYETRQTLYLSDEQLIGDGDTVIDWTFRKAPPVPQPYESWKAKVATYVISYNSSEIGYNESKGKLEVVYEFGERREVKLSGCTYAAMTVEATFIGDTSGGTQRWIWFPDLGFGLETQRNGTAKGLTMMKAK